MAAVGRALAVPDAAQLACHVGPDLGPCINMQLSFYKVWNVLCHGPRQLSAFVTEKGLEDIKAHFTGDRVF